MNHLEDLGINGRIILKWSLNKYNGRGMDWIYLAHDREKWRALVNVVMVFSLAF
jgi:hypothetical protein